MRKLAVLRSNETNSCPWGLPIPYACSKVGKLAEHMKLVETEQDLANNLKKLQENPQDNPCPYLEKAINTEWVDCSLQPDKETGPLRGSPLYYKWNTGVSLTGGDGGGFPLGYYNDNSIDRTQQTMYNLENLAEQVNQFCRQVLAISRHINK